MAMNQETLAVMCRLPAVCLLPCFLLTACSRAVERIQVSHSGSGAYEAALATDEKGFAVAWYDSRDGNPEIYFRLLDESRRPLGAERRLTETPDASYEPSLERLGDSFAMAWYEQTSDGRQTAMLGEWNRDGTQKWVQAIAPASRNPVIVTDGEAIIAAWIQAEPDSTEWIYMGTWDREGRERRGRGRVGPASKNTWNLNIAVDRSGTWIVYDAATSTRASRADSCGAVAPRRWLAR